MVGAGMAAALMQARPGCHAWLQSEQYAKKHLAHCMGTATQVSLMFGDRKKAERAPSVPRLAAEDLAHCMGTQVNIMVKPHKYGLRSAQDRKTLVIVTRVNG